MRLATLALVATAPIGIAAANAQGFPEAMICTVTELTCVTLCPAIGLVIPKGMDPVRVEGLPGGDLSLNVAAFDEQTPPTVRLEGEDAQGKRAR